MDSPRIKILVNASSANKGGGYYRTLEFIAELSEYNQVSIDVIPSKEIEKRFSGRVGAADLLPRPSGLCKLRSWFFPSKYESWDLVVTPYGPSLIRFRNRHLMGLNNAWIFQTLAFNAAVNGGFLKGFWPFLKRRVLRILAGAASEYWTETHLSAAQIRKNYTGKEVVIIPNLPADGCVPSIEKVLEYKSRFRAGIQLVYVAEPYPHKNYTFVRQLLLRSCQEQQKIQLHIVCSEQGSNELRRLFNGPLEGMVNFWHLSDRVDIVSLIEACDLSIAPSHLETYSAFFGECLVTETPIIASDLDFTREALGEDAVYVKQSDETAWFQAIKAHSGNRRRSVKRPAFKPTTTLASYVLSRVQNG